ncbi:MAG: hypothetical protein COW24_03990 [Candidatus Kerfeldbacteria bacterium CG15_BIG_FIL_POST_REV_8_21_14_020_45_12]|uniref:Cell envelope-related transcriptional attenuator domain-containing protein n=1 Tax=Candidatus Kerfeldbacteria bacterium CG15_BIG_FIL_POST_REV_8_21_14_020_45_12 TaxID=2014247 RepID=A0A2M7H384_9BACT|nr:MAG: hypothetical protein COW24_03990 [Candidatus Kerfeldbacteria bacterium CG15_BIG_FIL_POST_REV_8_21_14_020_45_12]PJA93847.1 MAG: hypothetical protein CO132_01135 [Candidatus Kerfeldbacteria bacterium CG_4_9_14_3_um_filter_45_8]
MRFLAFIIGLLLSWFVLAGALVVFLYVSAPDRYNVLVIGSDQRGTERARSDVLFVVSIPKKGKEKPYFLTIPRDTKIDHDEWGMQKITHFYALGDRSDDGKLLGNYTLTTSVVEDLLDIKVDATLEVTFGSFEEIIDSLGGATLNGKNVNGADALAVVRDRFTDGRSDFDRQADGREIFRSLLTKIKEPAKVKALQQFFADSNDARLTYSKTRLTHFLVGAGIARRGNVSIGEIEEGEVPGASARIYTPDFGKDLYYWVADEEELKLIVDEHFR